MNSILVNKRTGKRLMKSILVFIDGTICDTRPRHHLIGIPDLYRRAAILDDREIPGSVDCLQELARCYQLVYMGARPAFTHHDTQDWLQQKGYPDGPIFLSENQSERLCMGRDLPRGHEFIAGLRGRWGRT